MDDIDIVWDLDDDPRGNVKHILKNNVFKTEVDEVLRDRRSQTIIQSDESRLTFGYTDTMRHLAVVWEHVMDDPLTAYPITAYETSERMALRPRKRNR